MNKYNNIDNYNRKKFYNLENKKFVKKSLVYNLSLKNSVRCQVSLNLHDNFKKHYKHVLTNRCFLSGRKSRINKNLNISRLCFLRLARKCFISGIRKSSW